MRKFHVIENKCQYCGIIVIRHMKGRLTTCVKCKKAKKSKYDILYNTKDNHIKYRRQFTGKIKCLICQKEVAITKQRIGISRFCSIKCAGIAKTKVKLSKDDCIRLYWKENKSLLDIARIYKCSQSIISIIFKKHGVPTRDFGRAFRHEKPWNYVNGISKRARFKNKGYEGKYKKLVREILKRDNYTCLICKHRGKPLEVDHIIRYSERPDLLFRKSNLQTLCHKCHLKKTISEHKKYWINQYSSAKTLYPNELPPDE